MQKPENFSLSKYNDKEQAVLVTAAYAVEPLKGKTIAFILKNNYILEDIGKSISQIEVFDILNTFLRKRMLKKLARDKYQIIEDVPFELYMEASKLKYAVRLANHFIKSFSSRTWFWTPSHENWHRPVRDIRLGLSLGDWGLYESGMNSLAAISDEREKDYIDHYFFTPHTRVDLLQQHNTLFQVNLIGHKLLSLIHNMEVEDEIIDYAYQLVEEVPYSAKKFADFLFQQLVIYDGYRGNFNRLEKMRDAMASTISPIALGLLSAMQNKTPEAIKYYEQQLQLQKQRPLQYPNDEWYVLNLLFANTDDQYTNTIINYIQKIEKSNKEHYDSEICLFALKYFLLGHIRPAQQVLNDADDPQSPMTTLLKGTIAYWIQDEEAIPVKLLKKYSVTCHNKGFTWLALQYSSILDAIQYDKKSSEIKAKNEKALGIKPIVSLYQPPAAWELSLNALDILAGTNQTTQATERIIWMIDFNNKTVFPKLQRINKKGSWTKGRRIQVDSLLRNDAPGANQQDIAIARILIDSDIIYNNRWKYYDPEELTTSFGKACNAMVDHPYIFTENKKSTNPCELIRSKVEIIVEEHNGHFELSFSSDIQLAEESGYYVLRETPTRYKVVHLSEEILHAAHIIGEKLHVPGEAKERLIDKLQGISKKIPIQSHLLEELSDTKKMPYDQRIYVHLLPVGDGFYAELFVKPFSEIPPYIKPGDGQRIVMGEIEGKRVHVERILKDEVKNAKAVREAIDVLRENKPVKGTWQLEDAASCLNLLAGLEALKKEDKIVVEWPKGEKLRISHHASLSDLGVRVREKNNWFELDGQLQLSEELVLNMQQLLTKVKETDNQFVEISDGQFLALTKRFRTQLRMLGDVADIRGDKIRLHPLAGILLDDIKEELGDLDADAQWNEKMDRLRTAQRKRFQLPRSFNGTLREYQKDGYMWLRRLAHWGVGACLADDMGLGKTIQALALVQARSKEGPSLVIAPASVCRNWVKEAEKFTPNITPYFYNADGRHKLLENASPADLIVATYGLLQQDIRHFEKVQFANIILDEAQAIKNRSAKRTKAALRLQGDFRLITTGTPIENHLGELWTLFQFINPGLLGSIDSFNDKFAGPIERYKDGDVRNSLRKLIQPFILRRRKRDVLTELPEKTEVELHVEMSKEEIAFYEALRRTAIQNLEGEDGTKPLQILAEITRLRQACCHPHLVDTSVQIASAKLEALDGILNELIESEHKVLIFSQFVKYLKIIEKYINKKGFAYQYLDGSTPLKKRQQAIDDFQSGNGDIFLISLKAGGTGLNLTAADYVVHMDPWWNPAVEDQASDRAHRIGQTRPVTVYRMITQGTIEEKIINLHNHKRELADSLLSGSDVAGKLSSKQLLELIRQG